ncbi:MAG: ATP-binding protein [Okeania sp. SIO2C2]|uniref:ATP-binding protein n=1 Tax=Okeania sp. SIO2C2 TaxID=2607787 RepID=UPI0013B92A33|nr:ATP-binding protein [Okeania sp. SIO2C2]NEP91155.1 ATP-binding protein [Okeania sp. SIO2C2]
MANFVRPDFKLPISDTRYFFGRNDMLAAIERSPFSVRILLGGHRLGKTSLLNEIQHRFLTSRNSDYQAFPVLFNLQQERPENLDHLRYLMIARLQEAFAEYKEGRLSNWRKSYRRLLRQISGGEIKKVGISLKVTNPDYERRLINEDFRQDLLRILKSLQKKNFVGVCYLIDGAEFIVSQEWANDAWSYLRALKDTDTALKPFVGLIFSGYQDLKDYQQKVGSPLLNIAEVEWLGALKEADMQQLIAYRRQIENIFLTNEEIEQIIEWSGGHPYLIQQLLNTIFDYKNSDQSYVIDSLINNLIRQYDGDFSAWWGNKKRSYSFSAIERSVYLKLIEQRMGTTESLAQEVDLSIGEIADALEVLAGTGVIQKFDDEQYKIGAKIFEQWVK